MKVRCKFECTQKDKWGPVYDLAFHAVVSGNDNAKVFEVMPTAQVRMWVVNARTAKHFEIGKQYYLDFYRA